MKRFLNSLFSLFIIFSLSASPLFTLSAVAESSPAPLTVEEDEDLELTTVFLNNYVGPELEFSTPYLEIYYSGKNVITSSGNFALKATSSYVSLLRSETDPNASLEIVLENNDPTAVPLDLGSASLYLSGDGNVKVFGKNADVGVRLGSVGFSLSVFDGEKVTKISPTRILEVIHSSKTETPLSIGLPGVEINSELFSYDQPHITYSYQKSKETSIFYFLEEIDGVNAKFDPALFEGETISNAETRLRASLASDNNNSKCNSNFDRDESFCEFFDRTKNSDYRIVPEKSELVSLSPNDLAGEKIDASNSYGFKIAFESLSDSKGFTKLLGFGPIGSAYVNGEEYNNLLAEYSRSEDSFLETFTIPLSVTKNPNPEPEEPEEPEKPEPTPEEPEPTDEPQNPEPTPEESEKPEEPAHESDSTADETSETTPTTQEPISVPKAPNTSTVSSSSKTTLSPLVLIAFLSLIVLKSRKEAKIKED